MGRHGPKIATELAGSPHAAHDTVERDRSYAERASRDGSACSCVLVKAANGILLVCSPCDRWMEDRRGRAQAHQACDESGSEDAVEQQACLPGKDHGCRPSGLAAQDGDGAPDPDGVGNSGVHLLEAIRDGDEIEPGRPLDIATLRPSDKRETWGSDLEETKLGVPFSSKGQGMW